MARGRDAVRLTDEELDDFLAAQMKVQVATVGPDGAPHLTTLFYVMDQGRVAFWTYAASQKIANLRRDPRISCLAEDGDVYEELRGVEIEGHAEVSDDPEALWRVGVGIWERYHGPYREEVRPQVELSLRKRVAVRVRPARVRSWDHRKLGLPSSGGAAGSTVSAPGRRPR